MRESIWRIDTVPVRALSAAQAVLLWLLLRNAYIVYHGRVQRHQSQARLDALVRVVLEKPPGQPSVTG